MKEISEKTGVSIGLLATLLTMLAGAGGTAVIAVYQVGELREAAKEQKARDSEQEKRIGALELGAVGNAATLANLSTLVGKMDQKLDRLLDNRTSNANFRPRPTP